MSRPLGLFVKTIEETSLGAGENRVVMLVKSSIVTSRLCVATTRFHVLERKER